MSGGVKVTVRTNDTKGSICKVFVPAVEFAQLWAAYPSGHPYVDAKGKTPPGYENQCAIKVSVALHGVGVEMKSFTGASVRIKEKKAAARATELAAWLKLQPFCGLPRAAETITGEDWQKKIKGRTGIAYFADYWSRAGETTNASGDHIDLWNGSRLTASGFLGSMVTAARYLGQRSFFAGTGLGYSDLGKSKQILFWEIK